MYTAVFFSRRDIRLSLQLALLFLKNILLLDNEMGISSGKQSLEYGGSYVDYNPKDCIPHILVIKPNINLDPWLLRSDKKLETDDVYVYTINEDVRIWTCNNLAYGEYHYRKLIEKRKYRHVYILWPTWIKYKEIEPYLLLPYMKVPATIIGLNHSTKRKIVSYEEANKEALLLNMRYVEISVASLESYLLDENK